MMLHEKTQFFHSIHYVEKNDCIGDCCTQKVDLFILARSFNSSLFIHRCKRDMLLPNASALGTRMK